MILNCKDRPGLGALRATAWLLLAGAVLAPSAGPQGTVMKEPDDTKPVRVTGCMTARTKNGGFILSGVFGRPVMVIGPNYLQVGLGHQVTLTGSWQTGGVAPDSGKVDPARMFVATSVKVTAKQCASPPAGVASPNATDSNKDQH